MSDDGLPQSIDPERSARLVSELKEYLLPSTDTYEHQGTTFAGYTQPVAECGGDWWTARALGGGSILVLIADVMGHDIGSAIIMGVGKAVCELACTEGDTIQPRDMLRTMNRSVYEAGGQGQVTMTCFVSVLDPVTRVLRFASAGHPQPLVIHPSEKRVTVLSSPGDPLGLEHDVSYEERTATLSPDDVVFWYTDGVTESRNKKGQRLSERRLVKLLANPALSSIELRKLVIDRLTQTHGSGPWEDDITFVVARVG